jgi:hypothetical protein
MQSSLLLCQSITLSSMDSSLTLGPAVKGLNESSPLFNKFEQSTATIVAGCVYFGFLPRLSLCCLSFLVDSNFFNAPLLPPLQDLHAPHLVLLTVYSASHLSHTHLSKGKLVPVPTL